jgi:hypothetical protein
MPRMFAATALAAAAMFVCCQGASAVPVAGAAIKDAATPLVRQVQFRAYRTRHGGLVKCYRTLVIGPYRCHYYRRGWR